jgi:predicted AAA+ superfamily ATPase
MEIKRDIYLDRLIRREKTGLIKIVTGVRLCGKSYLLFNLFHNYLLDKGVKEDHISRSPWMTAVTKNCEIRMNKCMKSRREETAI